MKGYRAGRFSCGEIRKKNQPRRDYPVTTGPHPSSAMARPSPVPKVRPCTGMMPVIIYEEDCTDLRRPNSVPKLLLKNIGNYYLE
jgi:hypothetical protein